MKSFAAAPVQLTSSFSGFCTFCRGPAAFVRSSRRPRPTRPIRSSRAPPAPEAPGRLPPDSPSPPSARFRSPASVARPVGFWAGPAGESYPKHQLSTVAQEPSGCTDVRARE